MDTMQLDTPQAAEQAFYRAFEAADAAAMRRVWDSGADVCCVHPMGRALQGAAAVFQGWEEVFASGLRLSFSVEPLAWQIGEDLAVSVVYEHIRVAGEARVRPPMLATHVFRRTGQGWRMTLHHASPAVVGMGEAKPDSAHLH